MVCSKGINGMKTVKQKLTFSSKAKTLLALSRKLISAKILPLYVFPVRDFKLRPEVIVQEIQLQFSGEKLIIRSSAKIEDTALFSNAGRFKSVVNVPRNNKALLTKSIQEVISSYNIPSDEDEVFVQPFLQNIKYAGVAFTSDMDTLSPYYVINVDQSGSTQSITGGSAGMFKTYIHFKNAPIPSPYLEYSRLIETLKELEECFDFPYLDVEFAVSSREELFILQVRPIVTNEKENLSDLNLADALIKIHKKISKLSTSHPNLLGNKAVYGVMPDWNPAEIIGLRPKMLAASLYKEVITDNIWAYQRDKYGYRNLRSHPLLLLYHGIPYIDVRVDFNSFIPKSLDDGIARKLVDFYLDRLIAMPYHHDKIEFEIVHSCFYFNLHEKLKTQLKDYFTDTEIRQIEDALLSITNKIIDPENGLYKSDLKKIEELKIKYQNILNSGLSLVDKIYWLLEDCKRYGTLPFAGIARAAFIATQFLRSFVELDIISQAEYNLFTNTLNTVPKHLNNDIMKYASGEIGKGELLYSYGHLRPGTYNIQSQTYERNFDYYFSDFNGRPVQQSEFCFSRAQLKKISTLIRKYKIKTTVEYLVSFIRESIEGREYAKFIFTKSLSKTLDLIEIMAAKYGVNKEGLVHLDIKTVLALYASLDHRDVKNIFEADIDKNKQSYNYTKAVRLPALITSPDDVYFHFLSPEESNFVTLKSVTGHVLREENLESGRLENKIVFIRSADPGYDFLFTKKIAGLVTQFGGANSHMAVRCSELGIPAVIGAGEQNYNTWIKGNIIELDCLNKQVRIIS